MKKKWIAIVFIVTVLTGCSQKLSSEKETFEDKGISYELQLPSSWEKDKNYQDNYSASTVFAATDKKSNSSVFIATKSKNDVDLKDFGKKTREQLSEAYNYEKVADVYMKEFKINKYKAFKFTVFTKFKDKDSWAHIYYIETKDSLVQLMYHSADDSNYKKRAEIIDESARSLVETGKSDKPSSDDAEENTAKNDKLSIKVTGYKLIENEKNNNLLAVKYELTNFQETPVQASLWSSIVTANYNDEKLEQTSLPTSEETSEIGELVKQSTKDVGQNQSIEAVVIYQLNNTDGTVTLHFSDEEFPNQAEITLDLKALSK